MLARKRHFVSSAVAMTPSAALPALRFGVVADVQLLGFLARLWLTSADRFFGF